MAPIDPLEVQARWTGAPKGRETHTRLPAHSHDERAGSRIVAGVAHCHRLHRPSRRRHHRWRRHYRHYLAFRCRHLRHRRRHLCRNHLHRCIASATVVRPPSPSPSTTLPSMTPPPPSSWPRPSTPPPSSPHPPPTLLPPPPSPPPCYPGARLLVSLSGVPLPKEIWPNLFSRISLKRKTGIGLLSPTYR